MKIYYITILIVPFLSSCYTDKEELLYPSESCDDLADVSFSDDVTPIIESKCLTCHNTANASNIGGAIILDSYVNFKFAVEDLNLINAVKHESGSSPMPKNGAMLDECDISIIETWVEEGSGDN